MDSIAISDHPVKETAASTQRIPAAEQTCRVKGRPNTCRRSARFLTDLRFGAVLGEADLPRAHLFPGGLPTADAERDRAGHRNGAQTDAEGPVDDLTRQTYLAQTHGTSQHQDRHPCQNRKRFPNNMSNTCIIDNFYSFASCLTNS